MKVRDSPNRASLKGKNGQGGLVIEVGNGNTNIKVQFDDGAKETWVHDVEANKDVVLEWEIRMSFFF